jgi:hypothetical protein
MLFCEVLSDEAFVLQTQQSTTCCLASGGVWTFSKARDGDVYGTNNSESADVHQNSGRDLAVQVHRMNHLRNSTVYVFWTCASTCRA